MGKSSCLGAIAAATCLALPAHAVTVTVYHNTFDAPPTVAAGVGVTVSGTGGTSPSVAPYNATFGNFWRNAAAHPGLRFTEWTLTNLPTHTHVDLGFIMVFLDSWDGSDGSSAPDNLNLLIDSTLVASYTYNNASGTTKDIDGGTVLHEYVHFGGNSSLVDTVVDMNGDPALLFPHTAPTLKIRFSAGGSGWEGGRNESWGIDNLRVDLLGVPAPIPEPSTYALLLGGLLGAGVFLRRRRPGPEQAAFTEGRHPGTAGLAPGA